MSAWASAQADRRASPKASTSVQAHVPQGPLNFRCDSLEVLSKPAHQQRCRGHVILRRDDLLLCCATLTGDSNADWDLQQVTCVGDVRLQRGEQTLWSDAGTYDVRSGEVTLKGRPLLERGGSRIAGDQMVVSLREQEARVIRPRGQLTPGAQPPAPANTFDFKGPLPALCPIAARPQGPR